MTIAAEKNWEESANELFCSMLSRATEKGLGEEMTEHLKLILFWCKEIANGESILTMSQKANSVFNDVTYLTNHYKDEFKDIDPDEPALYYDMLLRMFKERKFDGPLSYKEEDEEPKEPKEDFEDKYLRLAAEFDNFKKRTHKEKSEIKVQTKYNTLSDLLDIIDDLEMASKQSEDEGVLLIINKLDSYIDKQGIKVIDTTGDFDVDKHESISLIDMGKEKKNKIIDCVKRGYELDGKILRYPKVVVGS